MVEEGLESSVPNEPALVQVLEGVRTLEPHPRLPRRQFPQELRRRAHLLHGFSFGLRGFQDLHGTFQGLQLQDLPDGRGKSEAFPQGALALEFPAGERRGHHPVGACGGGTHGSPVLHFAGELFVAPLHGALPAPFTPHCIPPGVQGLHLPANFLGPAGHRPDALAPHHLHSRNQGAGGPAGTEGPRKVRLHRQGRGIPGNRLPRPPRAFAVYRGTAPFCPDLQAAGQVQPREPAELFL